MCTGPAAGSVIASPNVVYFGCAGLFELLSSVVQLRLGISPGRPTLCTYRLSMRSAVAALLLAEAALSGSLVTAQLYNERRTCLVPDGPGRVNQLIDLYEVVATAEHLQLAVGRGTRFIFLINDVDMRTLPVATTEPNCGVLKATTTSVIQVGHDHS